MACGRHLSDFRRQSPIYFQLLRSAPKKNFGPVAAQKSSAPALPQNEQSGDRLVIRISYKKNKYGRFLDALKPHTRLAVSSVEGLSH